VVGMKSYKDLEIYRISYELAVKVHKFSMNLPKYELFEEGGQVRRSSKGVTSCIVEGYGRRKYKAEFIKFLIYAHSSCDETIVHQSFLRDTHNLEEKTANELIEAYEELGGKINRFIQYVEKEWNQPQNS
jgi:four helix bundle protein